MKRSFWSWIVHILLIVCMLGSLAPLPVFVPGIEAGQGTAGLNQATPAPSATPAFLPYPIPSTPPPSPSPTRGGTGGGVTATPQPPTATPTPDLPTPTPTPAPLMAHLALSLRAQPSMVGPGDLLTYTILLRNEGPVSVAGVTLSDTLPADVS